MRRIPGLLVAVLLAAAPAFAEEAVGIVGIRSVDVPTASLAPFEAALDRSVSVHTQGKAKTATLNALGSDPEVMTRREDGRRAANAGANAMRQLELDKAQEEFDKAATFFVAAHVDRLEPSELARIYTTRAKLAQMQRASALMRNEFERALPLHATKQLDASTFPPESVALFGQALADAQKAPMTAPPAAPLQDIGRRTLLRWILAGEVRGNAPASPRVILSVVDADTGVARSVDFLAPPDNLNGAFDAAVAKILSEAGVPARVAAASATTEPMATATPAAIIAAATPRPVPSQALPRATPKPATGGKPIERRWYFLAGAALLALSGGVVLAAGSGKERKNTQDPPPDEGITLVIEQP